MKANRIKNIVRKTSLLLNFSIGFLLAACGSGTNLASSSSSLEATSQMSGMAVIYFSCTNATKGIADKIAEKLSCPEIRIIPKEAYASDDLNYNDNSCRANREQNDPAARPAIENAIDFSAYQTIFLGYPIWWGTLPKIIYTLCDNYDFSNRTLVPFCTSGSSGIESSVTALKTLEQAAGVLPGKRFASSSTQIEVDSWITSLSL
jgi:flavodoxin